MIYTPANPTFPCIKCSGWVGGVCVLGWGGGGGGVGWGGVYRGIVELLIAIEPSIIINNPFNPIYIYHIKDFLYIDMVVLNRNKY